MFLKLRRVPRKGAKSRGAAVKKKLAPKKGAKSPVATSAPWHMRKRRTPRRPRKVFPVLNQLSKTFNNNLGLIQRCIGSVPLGKDEEKAPGNFGTFFEITPYLYGELGEEILLRLPVRSLIRFRCVCKSWRDLIDDEKFIYLHQKNNKTSYLLMGNRHILTRDESVSSFLPAYANDASQKAVVLKPPPSVGLYRYDMMAGACNGIVCLYKHIADRILLWNPAIKDIKFIPESTVPRLPKLAGHVVGFGFDPQRNDYKILQMVHYTESPAPVLQLELYSLRANSWKKIDCDHDIEIRDMDMSHGVCTLPFTDNRVVCFLTNIPPKQPEIVLFDMSSETLEIIEAPVPVDVQRPRCYNLFPLKSSIGLGIGYYAQHPDGPGYYEQHPEQNVSDIYVLNDFYATQRSWTKLFSVNHQMPLTPVASWDNLFFLQEREWKRNLLLLDNNVYRDNPNLVRLGIICPSRHAIFSVYRESLVRISKMEEKPSFPSSIKKRRSKIRRSRGIGWERARQ